MLTVKYQQLRSALLLFLFNCQFTVPEATTRNILTAKQFQHALDHAYPGDVIKLRSNEIFFEGQEFTASRSGEAGDPIIITGSGKPGGFASFKLDAGVASNAIGTTALKIVGDFWIIEDIELVISHPFTGVRIEGNNNSLSSLLVTGYETGVSISGSGNFLSNSIINSTHGTGIYVEGSHNNITANYVEGTEWALYITHGTCCEDIASNTVKGPVMVQGGDHFLNDNAISGPLLVTNCNNRLSRVIVDSRTSSFPENCLPVNIQGVLYTH